MDSYLKRRLALDTVASIVLDEGANDGSLMGSYWGSPQKVGLAERCQVKNRQSPHGGCADLVSTRRQEARDQETCKAGLGSGQKCLVENVSILALTSAGPEQEGRPHRDKL